MKESEARQKVVDVAKSFLGCKKSDGSHKEIIDGYNRIKSKNAYTMQLSDAYCAAFASFVGNKAGFGSIIPIECSCQRLIELFKNLGCWEEDGTVIPKTGDYIFFNWDDGTQPNDGWSDHVGIIVGVSGDNITLIEGNNANGEVGTSVIKIGWGFIRGYGLPRYDLVSFNEESDDEVYALGEVVSFTGNTHYTGSYENANCYKCTSGNAQITAINLSGVHKYHLISVGDSTVYGWVNESDISKLSSSNINNTSIKKGDKVKVLNAVTYSNEPFKVYYDAYDVIQVDGNRVVIGKGKVVTCAINISNISLV